MFRDELAKAVVCDLGGSILELSDQHIAGLPIDDGCDASLAASMNCVHLPVPDLGAVLRFRRSVLDHGFPVRIFDRLPPVPADKPDFAAIVDARAQDIVAGARRANRPIHLLWSGGIDSTTACIAVMRALGDDLSRLAVYYNAASRAEYPHFFANHLKKRVALRKLKRVGDAYTADAIVVTGELGDQLFGSAKALDVGPAPSIGQSMPPFPRELRAPWPEALPPLLSSRLASSYRADLVFDYLRPQIERAPVAVDDLFTCLWWLNFTCKWQAVSLRMMSGTANLSLTAYQSATRHFFQTTPFQEWALAHPGQGVRSDWASYKWPARDYIHAFTGDDAYHAGKTKEPSLQGLIRPAMFHSALAIDASGQSLWQPRDDSLRQAMAAESGGNNGDDGSGTSVGFSMEYEASREQPLWDSMSSGE